MQSRFDSSVVRRLGNWDKSKAWVCRFPLRSSLLGRQNLIE